MMMWFDGKFFILEKNQNFGFHSLHFCPYRSYFLFWALWTFFRHAGLLMVYVSVRASRTSLARIHWILRQDQKPSTNPVLHHLHFQCNPTCGRSCPRGLLWQQSRRSWLPSKRDQSWSFERFDCHWMPLGRFHVARVLHGYQKVYESHARARYVARGLPQQSVQYAT